MHDPRDGLRAAIDAVSKLRDTLKRSRRRQVSAEQERALVRATAEAWFRSLKPGLALAATEVRQVDDQFALLLDYAEKHTTRARYLSLLATMRTQLGQLRTRWLSGLAGAADQVAAPNFAALVTDPAMQAILARRWKETRDCLTVGANLAATVMMGGLLEALFLTRVNQTKDKKPIFTAKAAPKEKSTGNPAPLKEWMLNDYIEVAHELKWIATSAKQVGITLRDFRNFIHPQKELTQGVLIDENETKVLWAVFVAMVEQLLKS